MGLKIKKKQRPEDDICYFRRCWPNEQGLTNLKCQHGWRFTIDGLPDKSDRDTMQLVERHSDLCRWNRGVEDFFELPS